ncbi:unnamed protein product [Dovyalis caffra]|uniref:Uncharacterized protein n=1 Tax=Dovyalis caffra TaxID=77055 RepID=A0AAV1SGQ5_9ROSI|nr:unnamed protein product [Dovyalis caffra]
MDAYKKREATTWHAPSSKKVLSLSLTLSAHTDQLLQLASMGGGDGGGDMLLGFTPEAEASVEQSSSPSSSGSSSLLRLQERIEDGTVDGECGSVFEGFRIPSSFLELQADQKESIVYREVLESYDQLEDRRKSLDEGKSKILSYTPGGWMENVIGMKLRDYDVPNTTILLLIGPKGSGKSSLVNRISKVFEDDKFASERAQSFLFSDTSKLFLAADNPSVGDGTYFLQEYMIPRDSTSFCLYDTRGLSYNSSDNVKMLKNWITEGVHHRELIIRPSDSSHLRNRMKCKAHGNGCQPKEKRMVNFVIFVVDGLEVLKSMDNAVGEGTEYTQMIATTFDCPYLSFNDDKPVVVVTHGDLLSLNDRARVRVHLGELLESHDPVTELAIVSMLHYSLEHADKYLPRKGWTAEKCADFDKCLQIRRVGGVCLSTYASLFLILATTIISIYTPLLHIHHPTKSKSLVDPSKSAALMDPPISVALLDPPKSKAHNRPRKSKAHNRPPKSKAHVDPPKSKRLANSHQSDDRIVNWRPRMRLWLD